MAATRWGCLGPGKISFDFFQAVKQNLPADQHEFISVGSRDVTRAQEFANKFQFKRAYGTYQEVADDKDVDVVYIGTLHTTHVDLALAMLKAGKHVLCEKPMAMNWKSAKQVLDLAKSKNLLFVEAVWSRWLPAYRYVRKELDAGTIGDVRLVEVKFCIPIAEVERIKNLSMGGGGLLDIGVYVVQLACFVYKEMPESITAVGNITETGIDECACIILRYKNGAMATLTYHTDAGEGDNKAVIMGKNGRFEMEHPFHVPTRVHTPSGIKEFPLKDDQYNFPNSAGLQYEAAACRESILNGKLGCEEYTHHDVEMVHTIMDEIRRQIGMKYPDFD